ncbi:MAG: transcriptional regulator [Flavobacteriales bacterium]|nr:transcriptional regulator [Flavobacteriales bacterium]|tara:strand:+ start:390 stop:806 length:417 start_codon:yes stop_codon:yes gene_type:complete
MKAQLLKSEIEYKHALNRLLELDNPEPGSDKADEFEFLLFLIENYEQRKIREIPLPHPIAIIKDRMENLGLKSADLAKLIGSKSHASEILNLKRTLSLNHIRLISSEWNIPARILVQEYSIEEKSKIRSRSRGIRSKA